MPFCRLHGVSHWIFQLLFLGKKRSIEKNLGPGNQAIFRHLEQNERIEYMTGAANTRTVQTSQ